MSESAEGQPGTRAAEAARRLERLREEAGRQFAGTEAALKAETAAHPQSFRVLELREASDQALQAHADAEFALYLLCDLGREAHAAGLEQAAREKLALSRSWLAPEPHGKPGEPEIEAGG